ncbi:MAG: folate family ECF transporter S component [Candidatus Ancillula trichonymphae]|jgi:ECF transporter S component (folate family)|nr:folate family ECF transporter S component [Candidatus Ancillula trichonymphae]
MDTETEILDKRVDSTASPETGGVFNSVYFEIACAVILLAACILFGRVFAINLPTVRIGFGFVPLMIAGVVLRPYTTVLVFVLSDVVGALLFPTGAFFIGFTAVALFNGTVCGLLLGWHNLKNKEFKLNRNYMVRIVVASLLVVGVGDMLLNTLMLKIIIGKAYAVLFTARLLKNAIFLVLHILVLVPIAKVYESLKKQRD